MVKMEGSFSTALCNYETIFIFFFIHPYRKEKTNISTFFYWIRILLLLFKMYILVAVINHYRKANRQKNAWWSIEIWNPDLRVDWFVHLLPYMCLNVLCVEDRDSSACLLSWFLINSYWRLVSVPRRAQETAAHKRKVIADVFSLSTHCFACIIRPMSVQCILLCSPHDFCPCASLLRAVRSKPP